MPPLCPDKDSAAQTDFAAFSAGHEDQNGSNHEGTKDAKKHQSNSICSEGRPMP
jgi:hypothetical protein